ncbi:hypothetical protein [Sporosarcina sp.]|uniref:hypothetical protein n=1 Tax=Sporosarcina sp. TaxID=49982 RepID=UPI0026183394|nr:hypothetical protein [Sporosarcina sp.]
MEVGNILFILLFYLTVLPLSTLLHEVGHGLGVIATFRSRVDIYLGSKSEKNIENFRLGRLHFHIVYSFAGFVYWEGNLNKRQRAAALAGGPVMSLTLVFVFAGMAMSVSHGDFRSFFWGASIANLIQFVSTVIPVTYPRWMGSYAGHKSDGLQLWQLLKNK